MSVFFSCAFDNRFEKYQIGKLFQIYRMCWREMEEVAGEEENYYPERIVMLL